MKKILACLVICSGSLNCQVGYIGTFREAAEILRTSPLSLPHHQPFVRLLSKQEHDRAIEVLINHAEELFYDPQILAQCVKYGLPVSHLATLKSECVYNYESEHILEGLLMAIRKNDSESYETLLENNALKSEETLDLVQRGRIIAACGRPEFLEQFTNYSRIVLKKANGRVSSYETEQDIPQYLKILLNLGDLNLPAKVPASTCIWDEERNCFVRQGTRNHTLPLHAAVDSNDREAIVQLLRNGANPHAKDHLGETALIIAQKRNLSELIDYILLHEYWKEKIFSKTSSEFSDEKMVALINSCPSLASRHIKDDQGNTLLHRALECDAFTLAQKLLFHEPLLKDEMNNAGESAWAPPLIWPSEDDSV